MAGWKREEVIGKPFVQPKSELMQESKDSSDTPATDSSSNSAAGSSSSGSGTGGGAGGVGGAGMLMWGVGMGKNSRYASNRAELLALYTGRKKAVTCCFRVALAKGQLVDVRCRCWLGHAGEGADAAKGCDCGWTERCDCERQQWYQQYWSSGSRDWPCRWCRRGEVGG